ncbi:MAG: hypothetical protein IJ459_04675 [Clostridia bacterium]|nr:hypothetical protein [Clostridia bacterium]
MKTPMTSKLFTKVYDPVSGAPHYVLTAKAAEYQQGFYFINNSMTRDGRYLWFMPTYNPVYVGAPRMLGYVDFLTDEIVICHDTYTNTLAYIDPDTGDAYFGYGKSLYKREVGKDKKAFKLCTLNIPGYVMSLATHLTRTSDKNHFFLDIRRQDFGNIQGLVDIRTGEFAKWGECAHCMNHGQINPKNDELALCAYDAWTRLSDGVKVRIPKDENGIYQRLWTVCADGTRKMHPPMHNYASHEWWADDGKKFYYCCDRYGIYGINIETGEDITVLEGVDPWHAHCTKDESLFVYDEKKLERYNGVWYRGCPSALNFYNRNTGKHLVVVSEMPENGHTPENQNSYHIDPHPRFTENEEYIVFTTTELGGCDLAVASVAELKEMTQ